MRIGYQIRCDGCGATASYANGQVGVLPDDWVCWSALEDDVSPHERVHLCSAACLAAVGSPPDMAKVAAGRSAYWRSRFPLGKTAYLVEEMPGHFTIGRRGKRVGVMSFATYHEAAGWWAVCGGEGGTVNAAKGATR